MRSPARPGWSRAMVATSFTLFGQTAGSARARCRRSRVWSRARRRSRAGSHGAGCALRRACDVVVYRLNEVAAGADPVLRERYHDVAGSRDTSAGVATTSATRWSAWSW